MLPLNSGTPVISLNGIYKPCETLGTSVEGGGGVYSAGEEAEQLRGGGCRKEIFHLKCFL